MAGPDLLLRPGSAWRGAARVFFTLLKGKKKSPVQLFADSCVILLRLRRRR